MRELSASVVFVTILIAIGSLGRTAYNRYMCVTCSLDLKTSSSQQAAELLRATTLAIGDSHLAVGFDPREYKGAYNKGMFGANFAEVFFRLRRLLDDAVNVDTVIVSIGRASFVMGPENRRGTNNGMPALLTRRDSTDFFAVFQEVVQNASPSQDKSDDPAEGLSEFVHKLVPYAGQTQLLWDRYRTPPIESAYMGYTIRQVAPATAPRTGKDRAEAVFGTVEGPSVIAQHFIERTIAMCLEKGLLVILVDLPVSPEYRHEARQYVPDDVYDDWLSRVRGVRDSERVWYFDLSDALDSEENVFQDGDHLNAAGARLATRLLREAVAVRVADLSSGPSSDASISQ